MKVFVLGYELPINFTGTKVLYSGDWLDLITDEDGEPYFICGDEVVYCEIWHITDPDTNQMYRVEGDSYIFREDRIINPQTKETEVFEAEMNLKNYTKEQILNDLATFGYGEEEYTLWLIESPELILECLFELKY